jgi:hypothetical protein
VGDGAGALGDRGEGEIGADGDRWIDAEQQVSSGVISEPPPTPVMPTSRPTAKPDKI